MSSAAGHLNYSKPGNSAEALAELGGILITMHSLSQGGGDRVAVLLANGFARAGIPTRLAVMASLGEAEHELRAILDPQVEVQIAGPPVTFPLARILERLRGVRFIRHQIDVFRPGVVLAAAENMAFVTALARPGDARSVFVMKLTNRLYRPTIGPLRRIYRYKLFEFIFARMDLVLTLTDAERSNVLSSYPGREDLLRTTPNPYVRDDMLIDPLPRSPGPPRLLSAGRMVAQKRFDILFEAFARVADREARLTILGNGPLRESLETLARSLGIESRVEMPGFVDDIVPWLRQSDLFVLSSAYEGLPAALVESLACNVPVVTTESFFGARALLDGIASCAIVPINDPDALAAAIDRNLLARTRSQNLRYIALPYRLDDSIAAHIDALAAAMGSKLTLR